jgi:Trk K+ transport system NAD-binding subunit
MEPRIGESAKLTFRVYRMLYGPWNFVSAGYRQMIILISMFIFGMLVFTRYEHLPDLLALFASVSTVTTIGLFSPENGNVYAMNRTEVMLVTMLMIVSVGAGASLVQSTVSRAISEGGRAEVNERLIKRLKKHVIVYGYSHMGKYIVERLEEIGYDYVVITRFPDVYNQLRKSDGFVILESETDIIGALKSAGIEKASLVIVADVSDSDNMRFVLTVRKLRPDIRIHTVVHDPSLIEMEKAAGADVVIPSTVAVGDLLAFSADNKELVGVIFTQQMKNEGVVQHTIRERSPLIGKRLKDVSQTMNIIGALRGGKTDARLFDGTFALQQGDILILLGEPTNLSDNLRSTTKTKANQAAR